MHVSDNQYQPRHTLHTIPPKIAIYKYDLKNNKLIIFNKNNKCIDDLKTNEIEKILVDDHRKMEINYSRYTQIKEHKIKLPLYVELKTDTFTMQINIQNDIIINNKNLNEKKPL